jgi:DNA-binding transcriptional LysR family regulator
MSVDLRKLRYFVKVAEELHFTRAAERLHLAQPALSLQIRRLEEDLGLRLFDRNTRQVRLTAGGEQFLEKARAVLVAYDSALELAASISRGETGHLALGISPQARHTVGTAMINAIREQLPGVLLMKREEGTSPLVMDVQSGHLDVALGFCPALTSELQSELIRDEPLLVAVPEHHRLAGRPEVALEDLKDETWLLPSNAKAGGYLVVIQEWCRNLGFEIKASAETTDYDEEFDPVRRGRGIELLTVDFCGDRAVEGVVFVPVLADQTLPVKLVWRGDDNPVLESFLSIARELRDANGWTKLREAAPASLS